MLLLTETWLTQDSTPDLLAALPQDYYILNVNRPSGKTGGGVAAIINKQYKFTALTPLDIMAVDNILIKLDSSHGSFVCVLVYRPPISMPTFPMALSEQLANLAISYDNILLLGDLNYWFNDALGGLHAAELSELLSSLNFIQHVSSATHEKGHILDQIWSLNLILMALSILPCIWSDHHLIKFSVTLNSKPQPRKLEGGMIRRWRSLEKQRFVEDLAKSVPSLNTDITSMEESISAWLLTTCNTHVPLIKVKHTRHADAHKWFSTDLKTLKLDLRQKERKWQLRYSSEERFQYLSARNIYKKAIVDAKTAYFSDRIENAHNKSKEIFSIMNDLSVGRILSALQTPTQALCDSLNV